MSDSSRMCPAGPKASYPRPLGAGVVGVRNVEIIPGGGGGSRIDDSERVYRTAPEGSRIAGASMSGETSRQPRRAVTRGGRRRRFDFTGGLGRRGPVPATTRSAHQVPDVTARGFLSTVGQSVRRLTGSVGRRGPRRARRRRSLARCVLPPTRSPTRCGARETRIRAFGTPSTVGFRVQTRACAQRRVARRPARGIHAGARLKGRAAIRFFFVTTRQSTGTLMRRCN
jgi:hypothetical protein